MNLITRKLVALSKRFNYLFKKDIGRLYVRASILSAEQYLKRHGPINVLIDNSALGHGITHETAWIDTGTILWGGQIPVKTGYAARIPVHAADSQDRLYNEITYLVGIAELARRGYINLFTSAELYAERGRQPIGRYRGYGSFDLNIFRDIKIPSVDGHKFDLINPKDAQRSRIEHADDQPFKTLSGFLPQKSNLDAWHIHTAHVHKFFCFLAVDFRLSENFAASARRKNFPHLDTRLMLPSELGKSIKLRPIGTFGITFEDLSWPARPDLASPNNRRTRPSRADKGNR